ncbi:proline-rich protein 27 [Balaenoptera ricei]|uniref:proline-rich protein 27 n=1 Tax=Balaenoptera ricei TaxID=2746895 RepID=UPI0028BE4E41|nr:proline-rich protein 27 [Balaenoptera ricei]
MKFFLFTCLLAVALAKHEMEHVSSSEESISMSQEKHKQGKNVVLHPSKENICSTFCEVYIDFTSVETAEVPREKVKVTVEDKQHLKQLSKISQFYQKFPQYIQALYQGPTVMDPWGQVKRSAVPFIPTASRQHLSTSEENPKKTVDMGSTEVLTKKTTLTEEEKNHLKFLNKINQYYQKLTWPQYLKTISQYQKTMKPWNHVKTNVIPYLDYSGNPGGRYPVNPALNIPYPMPDSDFAFPVYPTRNKFPSYPGNPDRDAGVPSYPWVLTAPGAPLYHIPSFPIPSWLSRHPLLPWAFRLVPPSKRPMGPYFPPDTAAPTAADPHVPKPLAPLTTNPPTIPEIEPPAVTEPDEAEPAAAAPGPQPSTSLDQVGCFSLTPVIVRGVGAGKKHSLSTSKHILYQLKYSEQLY